MTSPPALPFLVLLCAASCSVTVYGCRKEAPHEIVKPGRNQAGSGGGNRPGGSRPDAGTGDSRADGAVESGGDGAAASGDAGRGGAAKPRPGEGKAGEGAGGEGEAPIETPPFTKIGLLKAAGQCAMDQYSEFEARAGELVDAARALRENPGGDRLQAARDAWLAANAAWQRAELFRFGPAAVSMDPGGQNLRDQIYIFPLINRCLIDQHIVSQVYADALGASLANARGMGALEYLLFNESSGNACSSSININVSGTWAALGEDELASRRAAYAAAAAEDVLAHAQELVRAWDPDQGNFYAVLVEPGKNGSVFAIDQDALNALSNALFYAEKEMKDLKLGAPLGLVPECGNMQSGGTCPDAVEMRFARVSAESLRENLRGLRRIFQGCGPSDSGLGFDDWLVAVGAGELTERMIAAIADAERAVDDLDGKLEDVIVSDVPKVRAIHTAVKAFTDALKTEFVTVLNLDVPMSLVGDND